MPSRIPAHKSKYQPDATRAYKATRDYREAHAFYNGKGWRDARTVHLALHPLCEPCRREGRYVQAAAVHHVKDRLSLHPSEWLSGGDHGLESCCLACHNQKRGEDLNGGG